MQSTILKNSAPSPLKDEVTNMQHLCCITVTYHPDFELLIAQLTNLPTECVKVLVDNGSGTDTVSKLKQLITSFQNIYLLENDQNIGLAAAINQGVKFAITISENPQFFLLLDQDSVPKADSSSILVNAFLKLRQQGKPVGCVGPLLLDEKTGLTHGFHQSTSLRWTRFYPELTDKNPVRCANLNGSGSLFPANIFKELGGLDDDLFIDHIDTEWSFRIVSKGYQLWGIPNAIFQHNMGESSIKFWFLGWKVWPIRSAVRHQYLFRNAILLMKRPYIPKVWKFWAIIKLIMTFIIVFLYDKSRFKQIKCMLIGVKMGIKSNAKLKS